MPTFRPKKIFSLSGTNMDFIQNVFFGDTQVDTFNYLDTTGISGVVPAAAYSSEIFAETNSSTLSLVKLEI